MEGRIKRIEKQAPQMPIAGKIKIGEVVNGRPRSLDYFRCDSRYQQKFRDRLGDRPDSLQITFPCDDLTICCDERYECIDRQGKRVGMGNGETSKLWSEKDQKYILETDRERLISAGTWKATLTLRFLITNFPDVAGIWELQTHGEASSIKNIVASFDRVLASHGTVVMVPFDLNVKKHKSWKPGKKNSYPVLELIPIPGRLSEWKEQGFIPQDTEIKLIG